MDKPSPGGTYYRGERCDDMAFFSPQGPRSEPHPRREPRFDRPLTLDTKYVDITEND